MVQARETAADGAGCAASGARGVAVLVLALAAALVAPAAVPQPPGARAAETLTGAGATFPYPLYSRYFDEYYRLTGVRVNYTDAQLAQYPGPVLHIPTALGAVVVTYHLPRVDVPLRFTGELLADIFLGEVVRWNDPRIQALNPGVDLPPFPEGLAYGAVQNRAGRWVMPSLESVSLAAEGDLPADTRVSLTDTDAPEGYPIAGLTWLLVYQDLSLSTDSIQQARALARLLWWIVHDGQALNEPLHYARLPQALLSRAEALLQGLVYRGQPLLAGAGARGLSSTGGGSR